MAYSAAEWGTGGITGFYRRDIIGGPGSFVVEAHDYAFFGQALKRKLLRELIASPAKDGPVRPMVVAHRAGLPDDALHLRANRPRGAANP